MWTWGVTTVPKRRRTTLPRTLDTLGRAGFSRPWLFVDGSGEDYANLPVAGVLRHEPGIGAFASWYAALWLLYARGCAAKSRFVAVFQDDVLASANLQAYLERSCRGDECYWNLYTTGDNARLPHAGPGFYHGNQMGRGAQGMVFTLEGASQLLASHQHVVVRPMHGKSAGIDGGSARAMALKGWKEMVHDPSLLQHADDEGGSAIGHDVPGAFLRSPTWRGEGFDCLSLLSSVGDVPPVEVVQEVGDGVDGVLRAARARAAV